jgi:hypothetical protein
MLAQAIQALESPEHDADVSEAEAIRNRLLDLDAAIGDRIQAKLDAHRLIVDSWGVSEAIIPRRLDMADEPIVEITDPLVPTIRKRYVMVVDRSNVTEKGQSPRVLLFRELPTE